MKSFFILIKQGDIYLNTWPKQKTLYSLFIDSKIVFYTHALIKIIPPFIVLMLVLNMWLPHIYTWPTTATFILFSIGLPLHAFYWLGKRSQSYLPNKLVAWYVEINNKLSMKNFVEAQTIYKPQYQDLAFLLSKAFRLGGDKFLQKNELI